MSAAAVIPITTGVADILSPSQVSTFRDCEARWAYKYLIGLPDQSSPALALGTAVDTAIKATWHHKLDTGIDLPVDELVEIFAAKWLEESAEVEFTPKQDKTEMAAQGATMIDIYMREAEPAIHPRDVDLEVRGKIAGVQVRGFVDLIDISGRVIELKTAGRTPSNISPNHAFQLATYAQLAPDVSPQMRVDTLVKLKKPKLVQIEHEITLPDYHYLRSSYPLVQEKMREGLFDCNRNSWLCRRGSCSYWQRCEAEYGGIVPGGDGDE
jgi:RecB family exonuclease